MFSLFLGIWVSSSDDCYFTDITFRTVRKVNHLGIISTVAGNGTYASTGDEGLAKDATFRSLWAVWGNSNGDLFVSDVTSFVVRTIANGTDNIRNFAGCFSSVHHIFV